MGAVLELLAGQAVAPGAVITPLLMGAGSANVVRSVEAGNNPLLLTCWSQSQAVGIVRAMSPRMANNNQGIHIDSVVANLAVLIPILASQKLYSQDVLNLGISGSAVAGDIEGAGFLVYYPDLPGASGNFITKDEMLGRATNIMTNRNALVLGAGGGYTGAAALNATENMFKANKDYAILGYNVSAACVAIRMIASDLGNIGIGGPGDPVHKRFTSKFFINLSELTGLPLIPVINSANAGGIIIEGMQDENAANTNVTWIFAELD